MFDATEPVVPPAPIRSVVAAEMPTVTVPAAHAPVMVISPRRKRTLPVPLAFAENVQIPTRLMSKFEFATSEHGPTSPDDNTPFPIATDELLAIVNVPVNVLLPVMVTEPNPAVDDTFTEPEPLITLLIAAVLVPDEKLTVPFAIKFVGNFVLKTALKVTVAPDVTFSVVMVFGVDAPAIVKTAVPRTVMVSPLNTPEPVMPVSELHSMNDAPTNEIVPPPNVYEPAKGVLNISPEHTCVPVTMLAPAVPLLPPPN